MRHYQPPSFQEEYQSSPIPVHMGNEHNAHLKWKFHSTVSNNFPSFFSLSATYLTLLICAIYFPLLWRVIDFHRLECPTKTIKMQRSPSDPDSCKAIWYLPNRIPIFPKSPRVPQHRRKHHFSPVSTKSPL